MTIISPPCVSFRYAPLPFAQLYPQNLRAVRAAMMLRSARHALSAFSHNDATEGVH